MKAINSVDAPSKAKPSYSEQLLKRRDFALELAKVDNPRHEVQRTRQSLVASVPVAAGIKTPDDVSDVFPGQAKAESAVIAREGDYPVPLLSTQQQLNVMVAPTGVTEDLLGSRVFGVHLLASTYLSELVTREEEGVIAGLMPHVPTPPETHMAVIVQQGEVGFASVRAGETAAERTPDGEAEIILNMIMNEERVSVADDPHEIRATAIAASSAENLAWPESLLRLTKGSDGSAIVWLRDYRVNDEDASRLASALVAGAQAQGSRLGRIVLNGREIWISPNKR